MSQEKEILKRGDVIDITCHIALRNLNHDEVRIDPNEFMDRICKLASCALEGVLYVEKRD